MGRSSADRLGVFAAATGALALVGVFVNVATWLNSDELPNAVPRLASGVSLALLSVGVAAAWRAGVAPAKLLAAGLGYSLLGAVLLAVPEYLGEYFLDWEWGRLMWLGLWILVLPAAVPAHPAKHALISVLSATVPAVLYWSWLSSEDMFGADQATLLRAFGPLYGCALLSLVPAFVCRPRKDS